MKKLLLVGVILLIIIGVWGFLRFVIGGPEDDWICVDDQWVKHGVPSGPAPTKGCGPVISSFDDCVAAGNPVMKSYPRQCRAGDKTFTEDIGNELEKRDLIRLDSPRPNQTIKSPLQITGQARGYWFFEAVFPVNLLVDGQVIAAGLAQAQEEWMTEDFVPFEVELIFAKPEFGKGELILERDNPSGLPENADELRVPVVFE